MAKRAAAGRKTRTGRAARPYRSVRERESGPLDLPFAPIPEPEGTVTAGDTPLHELFQQQTMAMLERADLTEEQKQSILVAMNCPCCGGSGLSFTMKLKRKT
ncbi:MAG: hypothetical protein IT536_08160 [Hyphomicrobiales bacterium]|nr:hypothetical protein [Hyphomicrobiales bacterium]